MTTPGRDTSRPWMINAHDLTRTVLCSAAGCENDAATGRLLCDRCERSGRAALPPVQQAQHDPDTTLWCATCGTNKPDDEFSRSTRNPERRERHRECQECANARKRAYRTRPDVKAREAAVAKAYHARRKAAEQ